MAQDLSLLPCHSCLGKYAELIAARFGNFRIAGSYQVRCYRHARAGLIEVLADAGCHFSVKRPVRRDANETHKRVDIRAVFDSI